MLKGVKKKAHFRQHITVSQKSMADFLGIRLSTLAMYEANHRYRSLPTAALLKLSSLQIDFEKIKSSRYAGASHTGMQKRLNKQENEMAARHVKKLADARYRMKGVEMKMENIVEKQQNLIHWLNLVDQRLDALPKTAETKNERLWLGVQQLEVPLKLLKVNKELAALQLQADLLQATAAVHEKHHQRLKK